MDKQLKTVTKPIEKYKMSNIIRILNGLLSNFISMCM